MFFVFVFLFFFVTDLVLLDAASVLAHELVKPTVDVAALLVLALRTDSVTVSLFVFLYLRLVYLRTVVAFVASSFRRNALPVVALETLGPAGEPPATARENATRQQISKNANKSLYDVVSDSVHKARPLC